MGQVGDLRCFGKKGMISNSKAAPIRISMWWSMGTPENHREEQRASTDSPTLIKGMFLGKFGSLKKSMRYAVGSVWGFQRNDPSG